jgi:hypothetical protein
MTRTRLYNTQVIADQLDIGMMMYNKLQKDNQPREQLWMD